MSETATPTMSKAATMLVCLGVEKAAQVFQHLSHEEVKFLATQITRVGHVNGEMRDALLDELQLRYDEAEKAADGGLEFVEQVLTQTFGDERAALVLEQLTEKTVSRPFGSLRGVEPHRILETIANEHPSIIALVVYYLPRQSSAAIIAGLPDAVRNEVIMRLVNLRLPMPQMIARLEEVLSQKLSAVKAAGQSERDYGVVIGGKALVEILRHSDARIERSIHAYLEEHDPVLAAEVRKVMFVFEDIAMLEKRDLQLVLREVPTQELALALKGAAEEIRVLVFENVSENAAKTIREELELLGTVRLAQVDEAQQKVVSTVRRLAAAEMITIHTGSEEEEMVS